MTDKEQREAEYAALAEESKAFGRWLAGLVVPVSLAGSSLDGACVVPEGFYVDRGYIGLDFCQEAADFRDTPDRASRRNTVFSIENAGLPLFHRVGTSYRANGWAFEFVTVIGEGT